MGQCSTLPEARNNSSAATRHDSSNHHHGGGGGGNGGTGSSRQRLKEDGPRESMDFNKLKPLTNDNATNVMDQRKLHVTVPANGEHEFAKFDHRVEQQPQTRDQDSGAADAMDVDQRDVSQPIYLPPPPACAVRTRCYKLNLDAEMISLTGNKNQISLGPYSEPPPPLTCSSSEDSVASDSDADVAIQTAQIFRGITIGKDGTILSQNARATRSNRGKQPSKKGEKSRQAAKIDKAKDLVEESIATGKDPETKEPANMVSLVIVGAYDDMKHLVRDGSKKLREANGLPDDTLFGVNRPRTGGHGQPMMSPSKNRVPPSSRGTHDRSRGGPGIPQSAPPKLKSNPRDSRSKVRRADDKPRQSGYVPESCNDMNMMDSAPQGGANGEGDWRDALGLSRGFQHIWNCGGVDESGTSPTQVCSPKNVQKPHGNAPQYHQSQHQQPAFEGRDSAVGNMREGEMSSRAN